MSTVADRVQARAASKPDATLEGLTQAALEVSSIGSRKFSSPLAAARNHRAGTIALVPDDARVLASVEIRAGEGAESAE